MIASEKLIEYLLNPTHERGGTKARLLAQFGYRADNWRQLEADIRSYHLEAEVDVTRPTLYGMRYEIHVPTRTPSGQMLTIRTIWQVDEGKDYARLITWFPD